MAKRHAALTPRERLLRTLRGQAADRVPLDLPGFDCPSRERLATWPDPLRRQVAERVLDHIAFRVAVPSHINRLLVTPPQRIRTQTVDLPNGQREHRSVIDTPLGELTTVTRWDPASNTAWTVKYPVETRADIDAIASVPWELPSGLAPPSLDDLPADFASRGVLETRISSPFVCVAGMMTYQAFLELCATDLPLVEDLAELCRQRVMDCVRVLLSKPGIEVVWMGGSEWLTPPMASPKLYEALVQRQEQDIIDYVHEHSDAVVHIHCHGRVRAALPRMIARGADYTEPVEPPPDGDITMAQARQAAAGRITLGGNVEARVLCNETQDAVEAAVRAAFEGGRGRFVLRPSEGPSPRLAEREFRNWMRLVDVWDDLAEIR